MQETTAEYTTSELVEQPVLRFKTTVSIGAKTDLGRVRENNEDKFEFFVPEDEFTLAAKGMIFVVCDGMGGHEAGQIASELATKTFIDVYLSHPSTETEISLRAAVSAANRFVQDVSRAIPSRRGMGTTLSALVMIQGQGFIAQVGDSRVYRMRDGNFEQLTTDHTWVEEMVRAGVMDRAVAESHPNRHMILRAIGVEQEVEPDIFTFQLCAGDQYLICSDGLTNHVLDQDIADHLSTFGPSEATWKLINSALIGGGSDNATAIVARIDLLEPIEQPLDSRIQ